ncbi:MAG: type III pantothenate kinase, partial [Clostridiales bacterium]|nr:type III pantothenate kinase [Clostridiales bacterium]
MILAIDIGNIRTTIALFTEEGALSFQSELETDAKITDDRCAIDLMGVFNLYRAELGGVDGAILSSVVPPITGTYARTLRRLT